MQYLIVIFSFLFSSLAMAETKIKARALGNGAWIKVTKNGEPLPGVIINNSYVTDATGRAYVFADSRKSARYTAVTPDGEVLKTALYIPMNNRN